jgi:ArsR family transcriptional regulator
MNTEQKNLSQSYTLPAQIFKVLTHPARLAILDILRDGEHCVCHMEAYLGYRQSYISQQLSVLREVGLIQDRRDGWNIYYRVADDRIYAVLDAMTRITGQETPAFDRPLAACPCPKCSVQESVD